MRHNFISIFSVCSLILDFGGVLVVIVTWKIRLLGRLSSIKVFSIESCLSWKFIFHWNLSSNHEGPIPFRVMFHQMLSSIKGHLNIKGNLQSRKVLFHQRESAFEGYLQWKVIFHRRSVVLDYDWQSLNPICHRLRDSKFFESGGEKSWFYTENNGL